ncbi:MAG TPA: sensor domain-containing phosphodiesterase [Candidatus Eremiobacteraceae bacterium]
MNPLVDATGAGVISTDASGNITYCSGAAAALFGFDSGALEGRKIGAIIEDRGRPAPAAPTADFDGIGLRRNGDPFNLDIGVLELRTSGPSSYLWVVRDKAGASVRKDRLDALWRLIVGADLNLDAQGKAVLDEGKRSLAMDFAALGHIEGAQLVVDFASPDEPERGRGARIPLRSTFSALVLEAKGLLGSRGDEAKGRGAGIGTTFKAGELQYVLMFTAKAPRSVDFPEEDNVYVEMLGAYFARLLAQSAQSTQIKRIAFEDELTGLPNHAFCQARLQERFAATARRTEKFTLFLTGFDAFKRVNDIGRDVGDGVLAEAARRLSDAAPSADVIARFDGDQFCVLVSDAMTSTEAEQLARTLIEMLSMAYSINGHDVAVTTSVGIVVFPGDAANAETFESNARVALQRAKQQSPGSLCFFSSEFTESLEQRRVLREALRVALDNHEFALYYQPLADLETGAVIGAEGLLRWTRPGHGIVLPGEFLSLAEESGLMIPIGNWVVREACKQCRRWADAGTPLRVAFNVSARQFQSPSFARQVGAAMAQAGADPKLLEIEITEAIAIQHPGSVQLILTDLRHLGVRVALDDFGTGYSSFAYLKSLPVDIIKIDQMFVSRVPIDNDDSAIVRAIIAFGLCTGRDVHAEGVESVEQANWLRAEGCDTAQGFLFGKAMPVDEFTAFVQEYNTEKDPA